MKCPCLCFTFGTKIPRLLSSFYCYPNSRFIHDVFRISFIEYKTATNQDNTNKKLLFQKLILSPLNFLVKEPLITRGFYTIYITNRHFAIQNVEEIYSRFRIYK